MDGFVTLGLETEMKAVSLLQQRHIPFVTIDGDPSEEVASVNTDDRAGAYQILAHLLAIGHRRIGVLSLEAANKIDHAGFSLVRDKRLEGYAQALKEVGLSLQDPRVRVLHCECSLGGRRGARSLLSDSTAPTAVAAMSDIITLGAHACWAERGIRIPDQISLAGYDDIPESALVTPALTTVGQQGVEKGKKAGEILCSIIHEQSYEAHVLFQPRLVLRESTGPPESKGECQGVDRSRIELTSVVSSGISRAERRPERR